MTDAFARAVYSAPPGGASATPVKLVARTEGLTLQSADLWHEAVSLSPVAGSPAVGVFHLDKSHHLLAYADLNGEQTPRYSYIRLPNTYLRAWGGNLVALQKRMGPSADQGEYLAPLTAPIPEELSPVDREASLAQLRDWAGEMGVVLDLLDAVISAERLLIYNGPGTLGERLTVVMGLMALLPTCARADLTFATQVDATNGPARGRVVFADAPLSAARHTFDWAKMTLNTFPSTTAAYVATLRTHWADHGDLAELLGFVDRFDPLAPCNQEKDFISRINDITDRYHFHEQVVNASHIGDDEIVTPDALKAALQDANGLPDLWRAHYAALLLEPALEKRDNKAHSLIARQMDADPQLDDELSERITAMLDDTPDLVYVFMRQRLSEGASEKWQARLHEAAVRALAVVLDGGDPDLVLSWLRLLAREPNSFGLRGVLRDGVDRALSYAYADSAFALNLLMLASRFLVDALDELLADELLLLSLPNEVRDAFAHYERDAIANLQKHSISLFLAGIGRAADARAGSAFEAVVIERLWELDHSDKKFNGRVSYTPAHVLETCAETGATWLPSGALEALLGLLLREKDNPLCKTFAADLAAEGLLTANLPGALLSSERDVSWMLDTVTLLAGAGYLSPQEMLTIYVTVLKALGWRDNAGPLMTATARVLSQNQGTTLPMDTLQTLLERAAALKDELTSRIVALALLREAATSEDDEAFVAQVIWVFSQLAWSTTARPAVMTWWRGFATEQPSARLSRIDDLLTGVRVMDDALETLRTVTAMRRLVGKQQNIAGFAESVNTAYEVLGTLAEAFEPAEKGDDISFEPETIRVTLAKMGDDLSFQQRQILANSLKGLAGLIAKMGDNRTKGNITRPSNTVDRNLITGEQMPQGAVDALKWLAGYFSRAKNEDEQD